MGIDLEKLDKERHIRLYEMFCSSWILNGGKHKFPVIGDRYILDSILAFGKISSKEAQEIENALREKIPLLREDMDSAEESCQCKNNRH